MNAALVTLTADGPLLAGVGAARNIAGSPLAPAAPHGDGGQRDG